VPSPEPAAPTNAVDAEPPSLVVVYVMDALRADFVGHLGGPEGVSPTLDRLAAEGMTFRDHHSVAPNTLPSTRALFTGRTVKHYRDNGRMPADGPPTLAERFQAAGYRTGLFSGNTYAGPKFRTDRGFDHVGRGLWIDPDSGFNDNAALVQRAALEWLSSLPPGEKAFLYLHTLHPHNPYDPPPAMAAEWSRGIPSDLDGSTSTLRRIRRRQLDTSPADRDRLRALYAASLRYNDQILGPFLERLVQLRDAAETVAVLTSDHGEELFDHGGILHGYTLYDEATRIPLILWGPGRIPAAAVDAPTSTLDLHPTLTALCRLPPADPEKGARDLLELAAGADDAAVGRLLFAAAPSVRGGIYSARGRRWKAVRAPRMAMRWGMGYRLGRSWDVEYLFDLRADPGETVNRAGHGDLEAAWARSRLLAWIDREVHLGTADGEPPELDAETREQLRALGYL
jgi:arylsulfatase A-like enzyme